MSVYNLLRGEDYINLPDNNEMIFAHLEEIARYRLNEIIEKTDDQNYYNSSVRNQYVGEVEGLIGGLGIDFHTDTFDVENSNQFENFVREIGKLSVRLRLKSTLPRGQKELQLSLPTMMRIKQLLEKLRGEISASDIDEKKKNRLYSKVKNLEGDLSSNRTNLSAVMIAVASVAVAVGGGTEFLANAPDALKTISRIIAHVGDEAEKADDFNESLKAEQKRLARPLHHPALPAPTKVAIQPTFRDDDEIPF